MRVNTYFQSTLHCLPGMALASARNRLVSNKNTSYHSFIRPRVTGTRTSHDSPACSSTVPQTSSSNWSAMHAPKRHKWQRDDLHVVLVNPQIPQNAGNVARTCAATSIALHLVGPLGFELDNTKLKRAGLDYWDQVAMDVHPSWNDFLAFLNELPGRNKLVAFSKFGTCHYATEGLYGGSAWDTTWLLFGAETTGLPPEAHADVDKSGGKIVKIPMANFEHVRSLNLATSVGVGVFEALRQLDGALLPENIDV